MTPEGQLTGANTGSRNAFSTTFYAVQPQPLALARLTMLLSSVLIALALTQEILTHQTPLVSDDRKLGLNGEEQRKTALFNLAHDFAMTWVRPSRTTTSGWKPAPKEDTGVDNEHETPLMIFHDHPTAPSESIQLPTDGRAPETPIVRTRPMTILRPRSNEQYQAARRTSLYRQVYGENWNAETISAVDWDEWDVLGPDVQDRLTLLELAKMTGNAYAPAEGHKDWYPIGDKWNATLDFGWEADDDGFRGHVFASLDKSIVVLSIKGTTLAGGGPTSRKDKINDNRLFSCCCARVDWSWRGSQVCDCFCGAGRCDNNCLHASLLDESVFYNTGIELYNNLTYMYPNANIWVVGHSLGGALASLIGATFGAPVVAFESPAERLATKRLHLPVPPTTPGTDVSTYHVYHTADPIPMGTCSGLLSLCSNGGFAFESRCHTGKSIVYDTMTRKGWRNNVVNHPIKVIITQVLDEDWEKDRAVPEPIMKDQCVECERWTFGDFKNASVPEL